MPPKNKPKKTKKDQKRLAKDDKHIADVAKKTINKLAETKYFNVSGFKENKGLHYALNNKHGMGVRGYATCENKNNINVKIAYGVDTVSGSTAYLDELNMNRCFANNVGDDFFRSQAMDGVYVTPSFSESTYILERDVGYITGQASDYSTLNNTPYFVRMIRVTPRPQKLSTISITPAIDLFVDEFGRATGINDADFLNHQLMTFKVNSRKYKIVEDKSWLMAPPMIVNNQATGQSDTDPLTEVNGSVNNYNVSNSMKVVKCRHNIGKKLFYEDGGQSEKNSTTGQQNEFIFFHTCLVGVNASSSINAYNGTHLLISTKSVSTFKDI